MAEKLAGQAAVVQVNADENPLLASRFGVRGIPVILLLRRAKVIDRLQGAHPADEVLSWFRQHG